MRTKLEQLLSRTLGISVSLAYPPKNVAADYSANLAFKLAKERQKEPVVAAEELRLKLHRLVPRIFDRINIADGFLNFTLSEEFLRKQFARGVKLAPAKKRKTIIVEYSSPNIGKLLSIAHIRSTIIGDALARIYRALGYKVITDNHLGDWGLQTGILIAAYKLWGRKPLSKMSLEDLQELYVRYNNEMREHDELGPKARMETVLLQKEDKEVLGIWKILAKKSMAEYDRLYRKLGVGFDYVLGESFYRKFFPKVVAETLRKGVAEKSAGAVVIHVGGGRPPLIIQKQDGGYLYGTFDLATLKYRLKRFNPKLILYVVSNEQALYFEQLFTAAEKLGWLRDTKAVHVKFGLIRGEDLKRLSTRAGKMISLEYAIEEAIRRARAVVTEKNPKLAEREKNRIARMVGIGALKYNDLSQNRNTDIIFGWDRMLNLQGNSAPYLQYTYARLHSILRKARNPKSEIRNKSQILKFLKQLEEVTLMKKVLQLPEAVEDTAKESAPNIVANYLWELANFANTFYEKCPVLKADPGLKEARLALVKAVTQTLKRGLEILGINAPERV